MAAETANCLGYEKVAAATLAGSTALTIPAGTERAWVQCETANVRWKADGGTPTASDGMLIIAGTAPIEITMAGGLKAARFIAASGSPILHVQYYGTPTS
jgi:hypothetical protein